MRERQLEPPENYMMEPKCCEDCKREECLLDLDKSCPEMAKLDAEAYAEWKDEAY